MTRTITIHFLPLISGFFSIIFTILVYFFYTLSIQLETLNFSLKCLQSKYTNLTQEIARLQAENLLLKEELNLIKKSHLDLSPLEIVPEIPNPTTSDEYNIFIIKVIIFVVAIILISIVIYLLSTGMYPWISQSFIGKLIEGTNALGLKAAEFMGLAKLKSIKFSDSLGNQYDVLLNTDNSIDVQIKSVDGNTWESIASFLVNQKNYIEFLTQQLATYRESNALTSISTDDMNILLDSFLQ
jgi:hypothetical protein